jgi:DMSO/TMAO reductase YedYZ molybdopterin-dependent catalytic subunit
MDHDGPVERGPAERGPAEEAAYDRARLRQWLAGRARGAGMSRRAVLRGSAGAGLAAAIGTLPGRAAAQPGPIVKPLPDDLFITFGTNAEMRWEAMAGQGFHTPIDRFFVRDHTQTAIVDVDTWRLRLFGTGLRGAPTPERPVEFTYADLRGLPAETITAFIECAGNGRSFYAAQQDQTVSGTTWRLGAVGVARWRGVRLATLLRRAGLTAAAVDVLPSGLDPEFVNNGVNLGRVRRPLPVAKALDDVLLAYEMNGETLPPDHGFPVRLVVPNWIGIASIKWVGDIEVSATPLVSPWNTQFYRLFGPDFPPEGSRPLTRQVTKSAFELPWDATLVAGRTHTLHGRSWSGNGAIRRVDVSFDGGAQWRPAHLDGPVVPRAWRTWHVAWCPRRTGPHELLARATDWTGATQPDVSTFNTMGYLFGAVVRHPVTVA